MVNPSAEALPKTVTRILVVGYDRLLNGLRSKVLRMSEYEVEEAFTVTEALQRAQSDSIDAVVVCHTVPENEKKTLVATVRKTRTLMPIFCVAGREYDSVPVSCVCVANSPIELLDAVKAGVQRYKSPHRRHISLAS